MSINLDKHAVSIVDNLSTKDIATVDTTIVPILNTPARYLRGPAGFGWRTVGGSIIEWKHLHANALLAGTDLQEKFGLTSCALLENKEHLEMHNSTGILEYVKLAIRKAVHELTAPIISDIGNSKLENGGFLYYWVPQTAHHRDIPFGISSLERFQKYCDVVGWYLSLTYLPVTAEEAGLDVPVYNTGYTNQPII